MWAKLSNMSSTSILPFDCAGRFRVRSFVSACTLLLLSSRRMRVSFFGRFYIFLDGGIMIGILSAIYIEMCETIEAMGFCHCGQKVHNV